MLMRIIWSIVSLSIGFILGYYFQIKQTRLLTREQLKEVINKMLFKCNKDKSKLIFFLINVDGFHGVIEAFGYDISNYVIQAVHKRMIDYAQKNKAVFYRFGIDEYVILTLKPTFDTTKIINEANKLLEIVALPIIFEKHDINVTASIGISAFPEYADDSNKLLRCVELALQNAKKSGRNTYSFYNQSLIDQTVDRAIIKNDLLTALHNDELQLVWQPQVDVMTKELVGAEALIRWKHISKGNISPEVFISIAETTGLIWQVGVWIIKNACKQCKVILQELNLKDFKVAINLSSGQFLQGDIVQEIANAIYDTGINPANFEVEITESMFMANAEKDLYMISVLNSMGIKIAIDDFGTGYSSFGRLRQLNFHYLKIDQSFIKNIDSDQKNYAIVSAIIAMAKSLNIKVIAEGLENTRELSVLQKAGCHFVQGYYISKPLTLNEFINFSKKNKI